MVDKEKIPFKMWTKVLIVFCALTMIMYSDLLGIEIPAGTARYPIAIICFLCFMALREMFKSR